MSRTLQYYQGAISGRTVKTARKVLGLSQPQFARYLKQQTGREETGMTVARYENYGARDTKKSLKPPKEVEAVIMSLITDAEGSNSRDSQKLAPEITGKKNLSDLNRGSSIHDDSAVAVNEIESNVGRIMDMKNRELINKVVAQYKELGLFDAEGDTAVELIEHIESSIRETERELVGSDDTEIQELRKYLKQLLEEEADIDAEIEAIETKLANLGSVVTARGKNISE